MRHRWIAAGMSLALAGAVGGAIASSAAPASGASRGAVLDSGAAVRVSSVPNRVLEYHPASTAAIHAAGLSLPSFSHTHVGPGGVNYTYKMVGGSPFANTGTTTVSVKIIPVKFTFTSFANKVFDASSPDPTCLPGASAATRTKQSPVFATHAYTNGGVSIGTGQYIEMDRRGEFWSTTKPGAIAQNNRLKLAATTLGVQSISVSGGSVQTTPCGKIGMIDINSWDPFLQQNVIPSLAASVGPGVFPLFVFYDVVLYQGSTSNCCILGYHNAYVNPAHTGSLQTYGVADYDTTKAFRGVADASVLTHEVGEWADDPDVAQLGGRGNPTPAWGGVGQVSGCQNNLENGDPLSGTIKTVVVGGITFHVQELAYVSWFYRDVPSTGAGGKYSNYGKFTHASLPCPPGG